MKKKFYTVYQITNKTNGMIYVGTHVTYNLNDSYMGSGSNINKAILNEGVDNFQKETLFIFDNKEEMLRKEVEIVDREFIKRKDTYNIILGGGFFDVTDTVTVKDKNGNTMQIHKSDNRFILGDLVSVHHKRVPVKDLNGVQFFVNRDDPRYLSGELKHIRCGTKHNNKTKDKIADGQRKITNRPIIEKNKLICVNNGHSNKFIPKEDINTFSKEGWKIGIIFKHIENKNIDRIAQIKNSSIDFSKKGWYKEASKILDIGEKKVTNWMRKNMNDFWNEKCYKISHIKHKKS